MVGKLSLAAEAALGDERDKWYGLILIIAPLEYLLNDLEL